MFTLRPYQIELSAKAIEVLRLLKIVYLAIEMRVGKTLISLDVANNMKAKNVLFVTKKKAISSIESDYKLAGFTYNLTVTNYEQLKKFKDEKFDLIIVDEAHSNKAYPKPSEKTKILTNIVKSNPVLFLSGTPTPESYSELYHQFWISENSPFKHKNFYSWAKEFVEVTDKKISANVTIKDYSNADRNKIMEILNPYFITYTQQEAGFEQKGVVEEVVEVEPDFRTYKLVKNLLKDKVYVFKNNERLVCDSAVKLQSKIHQVCSGTVITEDGNKMILDPSKAKFISENYKDKKIAVFYKFQAEQEVLKQYLKTTDSPEIFNNSVDPDLVFISQIQSGSMGVNLSSADVLIFYNIDFAAVQYWQARERIQSFKRTKPALVHWLFIRDGIEHKIYKAVQDKKDYTNSYFKRDYGTGIGIAKESIKVPEKSWNLRKENNTGNTIRSA